MKYILATTCYLFCLFVTVQSVAQMHAHNDYEKSQPFYNAYKHGAGSIEADIFLADGELLVAHDPSQLDTARTIESLYLVPLDSLSKANGLRPIQLMVDLKTSALPTLAALVKTLENYPSVTRNKALKIVISGNRPSPSAFKNYPDHILFDGLLTLQYSRSQLKRVPMFSDNFSNYSQWKGTGALPSADAEHLLSAIKKAHQLGKTIRFWNAPDNLDAWTQLKRLNADWINTDKVEECAAFLNSLDSARGNHPN